MSKSIRNIGIVSSIIGAIITCYGATKNKEAQSMLRGLRSGDELFGTHSTTSINVWTEHSSNYKIILIVGSVILVVGIILLIAGLVSQSNSNNTNVHEVHTEFDITEKLKKLEKLKTTGLITEEEFAEKRKDLLSRI